MCWIRWRFAAILSSFLVLGGFYDDTETFRYKGFGRYASLAELHPGAGHYHVGFPWSWHPDMENNATK